jgi:hypothetical protein
VMQLDVAVIARVAGDAAGRITPHRGGATDLDELVARQQLLVGPLADIERGRDKIKRQPQDRGIGRVGLLEILRGIDDLEIGVREGVVRRERRREFLAGVADGKSA